MKIYKIFKTWKFRFCTIQRESFSTVMRNLKNITRLGLVHERAGNKIKLDLQSTGSSPDLTTKILCPWCYNDPIKSLDIGDFRLVSDLYTPTNVDNLLLTFFTLWIYELGKPHWYLRYYSTPLLKVGVNWTFIRLGGLLGQGLGPGQSNFYTTCGSFQTGSDLDQGLTIIHIQHSLNTG